MASKARASHDDEQVRDTETDASAKLGAAVAVARDVGGVPYVVIPEGYVVEDLSGYLPRPLRRSGQVTLADSESFIRYVERFKTNEAQIFSDQSRDTVTAIFDFHEEGPEGRANWISHTAVLKLQRSPEWTTWNGRNNKPMSQADFAQFLEDNLPDIASPDGATVLEAAKSLELHKSVFFKRGINTENGTIQLTYNEEINQGNAVGHIVLPTQFVLGLPVYENGQMYRVDAKLRYKITDEKIAFTFLLDRPHKIIEKAFSELLAEVRDETGIQPFLGSI
jgi:uncharacterized protein YfdQ (DUF2303 family)